MSQPLECPRCGLFSPPNSTRCDCGYNFENPSASKPLPRSKAIGGWLLLVAFGVVISPVLLARELYSELYPVLIELDWHSLSQKEIALTVLIIVGELALVVWAIYNAVLFFKKRKRFPWSWVGLNGLILVLSIAVAIFDAEFRKGLGPVIFWTCIWIAYMLRSERVKDTFVH